MSQQAFGAPTTGIDSIDQVLTDILPGDNIVWQVDDLADYRHLATSFAQASLGDGRRTVYLRFAPHEPVLPELSGLERVELQPSAGFDAFAQEVHELIAGRGRDVFYVFDNLSELVGQWNTDDSLANFFRVACPFLYQLDTVTYFALTRGQHHDKTIARIRDTTQVLVDVFHHDGRLVLHVIKALDRYSPSMFLPHIYEDGNCTPVFESGEAAEILSALKKQPLRPEGPASVAPWDRLFLRIGLLERAGRDLTALTDPEIRALRDDLLRMTMGDRPEMLRVAQEHITLADLTDVRERLMGSGRIGGKASGMILARRVASGYSPDDEFEFSELLEPHDSFYIGSDVFFSFLVDNNLFAERLRHTGGIEQIREQYPEIRERFLNGSFSPDIQEQFSRMLDYFGQAPIIVRSSSLLEDDFGNAFAGKYESVFCPNQGHLPERLEAFTNAVKKVYASALSPDALAYRRKHSLEESDEQMAVLVQRVAGLSHGPFFMPLVAGVGFSRSPFSWSERLDPTQGMLRLVIGLGTRAVDRVGGDFPRMLFLSHPELRPEAEPRQIVRYSQHLVDVLDIPANSFSTVKLDDLLEVSPGLPHARLLLSAYSDGHLSDPLSAVAVPRGKQAVATLNNLIRKTQLPQIMRALMAKIERAYGRPVDIEFTVSLRSDGSVRINLLQCRPLRVPGGGGDLYLPVDVADNRILFRTSRCSSEGICKGIQRIVYIDPLWYAPLPLERKMKLGRVIGLLNNHPEMKEKTFILMGPGRWGSSNIDLGVNVSYADINNASVLAEIAREHVGHTPELSFGTHFFQDLVEDEILYVPVYPDAPDSKFNQHFFLHSPNALRVLLPDQAAFEDVVKVIDVQENGGAPAELVMDASRREAICFLGPKS